MVWSLAALVVLVLVATVYLRRRRSRLLREEFGLEYLRALDEHDRDRAAAERELMDRAERHVRLAVRDLDDGRRAHYLQRWERVLARFPDEPDRALADAEALVREVLTARGYPQSEFERIVADVSVEHPDAAIDLRAAQELGAGDLDDRRRAMLHYRAVVQQLLAA